MIPSLLSEELSRAVFTEGCKPIFKRLLQWLLVTMGNVSFAYLKNYDSAITNLASQEAFKWSEDLWGVDETVKPDSGDGTLILGIRLQKVIPELGKSCGIKIRPKKEKATPKSTNVAQGKRTGKESKKPTSMNLGWF